MSFPRYPKYKVSGEEWHGPVREIGPMSPLRANGSAQASPGQRPISANLIGF